MFSRLNPGWIVLVLIPLCGNVSAAPAVAAKSTPSAQVSQASTNMGPNFLRPDQVPISPISALNLDFVHARTNPFVRVRGIVLDQGLGEYVIIQDDSGSIRADTRQTIPLAG